MLCGLPRFSRFPLMHAYSEFNDMESFHELRIIQVKGYVRSGYNEFPEPRNAVFVEVIVVAFVFMQPSQSV